MPPKTSRLAGPIPSEEFSLRILLTVHQFVPDYSSGTEVLTFSVAKELIRRGHEVFVLTGYPARQQLPDSKRFDSYTIEGIVVHRFHHAYSPMGEQHVLSELEYDNQLSAGYFSHLVDVVRPDIVHFFHFSRLGVAMIEVARHKAIPAYYTPTDFWSVCPTSQLLLADGNVCLGPTTHSGNCIRHVAMITRWRNHAKLAKYLPNTAADWIARFAKSDTPPGFPFRPDIAALSRRAPFNISRLNALHGIVSPTRLMTDVLTRNGVDKRLIVQSAFGLDVSGFDNITRRFDAGRPLTIGYIGTLAPHKGCHVLIKAFRRLNNCRCKLKIYGSLTDFPDYVSELEALSAGNEEIDFLGTFPNAQIADVLSGVDVLVVPSVWYENTPLVVYSALAAKCPVVASDFPGLSETVRDGLNGLTFEPRNAEALANCLNRLIGEPDLIKTLSANCLMPKSISEYVDELLVLYKDTTRSPIHLPPPRPPAPIYNPKRDLGHITGWAVVRGQEPKGLCLLAGGKEVARTSRLQPRPDIRAGFASAGKSVTGVNFGFAISIEAPLFTSTVVLAVIARDGAFHELPLSGLVPGSVSVTETVTIGIDEIELTAHSNAAFESVALASDVRPI